MTGYWVIKQQVEPGCDRLAECDEFGCVTVHTTRRGADAACASLNGGQKNGYFVARDQIRREQTIVNEVE